METALLIEKALLSNKPLHGVLFDIRKCFDTIPWGIAFGLLRDMGMDERVIRPLRSMYDNLRRHMKVLGTAGEDFQATNGILQGCALSVIVLNAVVAVWDRAVRAEAQVRTNAYADDTKVMSEDAKAVQEGVRLTEEFGAHTGLQYAKTHAFSTAQRDRRPDITMYGEVLEMKDTFRDLGAEVSAVRMKDPCKGGQASVRCENAYALLDRITYLEGATFECRATMVMSMVLPSALFGTATANPEHHALRTLTSKCVAAIRGGRVEYCGRRYRCTALVTNLLCPGHRADPIVMMDYQRILAMVRVLRCTRLGGLAREVYRLARPIFGATRAPANAKATAGPVSLMFNTCGKRGWKWLQPDTILADGGTTVELLGDRLGKVKHEVRDILRTHVWARTAENRLEGHFERHGKPEPRRDVQGIGGGIDYKLLVSVMQEEKEPYRQAVMHSVVTGGILTEERLAREGLRDLPEVGGPHGRCTLCNGAMETLAHMRWSCPYTDHIRQEAQYRDVVLLDKSQWPECINLGLLPTGFRLSRLLPNKDLLPQMMKMFVDLAIRKTDIALRREETELAKTANRGYPWGWRPKERSAWRQAQELEEHPPRKWRSNRNSVEDVVLYMALRKWCQSLEWPAQQPAGVNGTTWLELAIDFEVSTGVRLTSHEGRLRRTMKEKATSMAHMEKSLRELYEKSKVPVHMFGGSTSRHINALSSLGIGMGALNGVTRRCVLSGGRRTEEVLDQICRSPGKKFMSSVVHLPTVDDETAMRLQLLQDEAENFCEERRQQFRAPELLGRGTVFFFDGGSRGNGRTVGAAGSGGCGFADGERTWEEHRRLTDGSSNNVAEYVALLLCLDQLVETKRRERARAESTIDIDIDIDIDGPRTNCELPGQSLSDASAVEQGSPTEPQDEGVDVDVDVDGDDGEEDGDDEEEDDEEDDEQDVEQDGEDGDRREEMSREESEEEAPQGPDRGRHASIRSGKKIRIFGDSRLVLQQVDGKWACAPQLWPYCAAAQIRVKWLEDQGHEVELLHVLRRFNKEADALANAGMDRPAEDAADFNIRPMPEDKAPS